MKFFFRVGEGERICRDFISNRINIVVGFSGDHVTLLSHCYVEKLMQSTSREASRVTKFSFAKCLAVIFCGVAFFFDEIIFGYPWQPQNSFDVVFVAKHFKKIFSKRS